MFHHNFSYHPIMLHCTLGAPYFEHGFKYKFKYNYKYKYEKIIANITP